MLTGACCLRKCSAALLQNMKKIKNVKVVDKSSENKLPVTKDSSGNIRLQIHAKPSAKVSCITGVEEEGVGVQLAARPVDGEANTELLRFIASVLKVKKSEISLDKGNSDLKHRIKKCTMAMNWFQGGVSEAITTAKTNKSPLIVFIASSDKCSEECFESLNTLQGIDSKHYVALRIQSQTPQHEQLKAVYGNIAAPSVLLLDTTSGVALERFRGTHFNKERLVSLLPNKITTVEPTHEVIEVAYQNHRIPTTDSSKNIPQHLQNLHEVDPSGRNCEVNPNRTDAPAKARIQLKLLSGGSEVVLIDAVETLSVVRDRAAKLFNLRGYFDLATPYPRRIYEESEYLQSVDTLGLCPASTILVLPRAGTSEVATAKIKNAFYAFFQQIMTFLGSIWGRFRPTERGPENAQSKTNIVRIKAE